VRVAAKTTHPSEPMKKTLTSLLLLLLAVSSACSAELFVDLKFEAACKQAAKENKLVLIDFYTTWCGPCKLLDKTTWTDQEVIKHVSDKAVALRIDAEKETRLASRYKIDAYPTIRPSSTNRKATRRRNAGMRTWTLVRRGSAMFLSGCLPSTSLDPAVPFQTDP
jgi:thiol-disulfide isomerase/thioredoxin